MKIDQENFEKSGIRIEINDERLLAYDIYDAHGTKLTNEEFVENYTKTISRIKSEPTTIEALMTEMKITT